MSVVGGGEVSYRYEEQRPFVFTDEGQRTFLRIRDFAEHALKLSGAVTGGRLIGAAGGGDTWQHMACVDRLVEIGELKHVYDTGHDMWQHRIYLSTRGDLR